MSLLSLSRFRKKTIANVIKDTGLNWELYWGQNGKIECYSGTLRMKELFLMIESELFIFLSFYF